MPWNFKKLFAGYKGFCTKQEMVKERVERSEDQLNTMLMKRVSRFSMETRLKKEPVCVILFNFVNPPGLGGLHVAFLLAAGWRTLSLSMQAVPTAKKLNPARLSPDQGVKWEDFKDPNHSFGSMERERRAFGRYVHYGPL